FIETVFAGLGFRGDWTVLQDELLATFREGALFHPFDDARALLGRLAGANVRVAVVSNWSPPLPAILARLGLARFVDVVVTSAVVRLEKRSEEHTSELQSRENLVCRLLLEKK